MNSISINKSQINNKEQDNFAVYCYQHMVPKLFFNGPIHFVKTIYFLFFIPYFLGCTGERNSPNDNISLIKKIVVSDSCQKIIYSVSKDGTFLPKIIDYSPYGYKETSVLEHKYDQNDYYPQSLSCDCNVIALLYKGNNDQFKLATYNINERKIEHLTDSIESPSQPIFSPTQVKLALLSNGQLQIYDYQKNDIQIFENTDLPFFRSLIWSAKGKYILLEDESSNIWRCEVKSKKVRLIWKAPSYFYSSRLITASLNNENEFFFISDHDSPFNQIYKFSNNIISLLIKSNVDKYILQQPIKDNVFFYKTNDSGYFNLKKYDGHSSKDVINNGVIYDFVVGKRNPSVMLYSDEKSPVSIFIKQKKVFRDILKIRASETKYKTKIYYNREGVFNPIYIPLAFKNKWIIWLHGGPAEEFSRRHNPFVDKLLENGFGVIALNYPGSTGGGNKYEYRGYTEKQLFDHQMEVIKNDIKEIKKIIPEQKKCILIGVSYGSYLAHEYANQYPSQIEKIVDFSGLADFNYINDIPKLYIYGDSDFSLDNPSRAHQIKNDMKNKLSKSLVISDEGHVISRSKNTKQIADKIIEFIQ